MKQLVFLLFICVGIGCVSSKKIKNNSGTLNGTWHPIKQEIGGNLLPSIAFAKQVLVISDSTYTFTAESVDKGALFYGRSKMDIYGRDGVNKGKHLTAIYKMENDLLTICYNLLGDSYPSKFEAKSKSTLFLVVFRK